MQSGSGQYRDTSKILLQGVFKAGSPKNRNKIIKYDVSKERKQRTTALNYGVVKLGNIESRP